MLDYENKAQKDGYSLVIGVDEVGRGPLAGPVVAAAVSVKNFQFQNRIDDSKKISSRQRELAYNEIKSKATVGIGIVGESIIDSNNILEATYEAMSIAIKQLIGQCPKASRNKKNFSKKVCLLIDGKFFKSNLPFDYQTIIRGDQLSFSVACASIVAKVIRDRILLAYHKEFPQYGFNDHKGYPTLKHRKAIKRHGPSVIHRKSFKCV